MNHIVNKIITKSNAHKQVHCSISSDEGMRKEAIVQDITGERWRMICDEGPYLNGADSAPPPLGFFSAGMAFGFVSSLNLLAEESEILIDDYEIIQDNFYTIEGSAIRGTMISGGLPVDVKVDLTANASEDEISNLITKAKELNPVYKYLENNPENTFNLFHNEKLVDQRHESDELIFKELRNPDNYSNGVDYNSESPIVSKLEQVETLFEVEGGKGSALQESQKRVLHIRAITNPHTDDMAQTQIQIFKPLGSTFQFYCDLPKCIGGELRTPSSLAYASAGIGFCFMTQIGRYASIKKYDLHNYSVDQTTSFSMNEDTSGVCPIKTTAHFASDYSNEIAREILRMSEQTCFLHGAMKEAHAVNFEMDIKNQKNS